MKFTLLNFAAGIVAAIIPFAVAAGDDFTEVGVGDVPEIANVGKDPATKNVTYLGITAKSVDDSLRSQLNLPEGTALIIMTVDSKGPAAADLHVNDVLQKVDDQILIDAHQLVTLIHLHHPSDTITLTVIREAKPIQVTIKLGEKEQHVIARDNLADLTNDPPFDVQLPLIANNQAALAFSDGTYSASVKSDIDGHRQLIVKNSTGNIAAQGPVDTQEQWNTFPPDIRNHLVVMQKMLYGKGK